MPKKKYIVELKTEERKELEAIVSKGISPAYRIKHANIVLNADAGGPGLSDAQIAERFACHRNTVADLRQRFVEQGLEAALERKKRQLPPVERLLELTIQP